ncbi:MAG: EndoU domain-containing protein [Alphaproteobacteria bacterium]|nr:EndoU domain-containing protein [Alphaproteobacteria bacterium]
MKQFAALFLVLLFLVPGPAPARDVQTQPVAISGAKASQVFPLRKIDWRHILTGEINSQGQATGFHYAGVDFVPRSARVVKAGQPDANGIVKAEVEIFEPKSGRWLAKKSGSTLFPADWTRNQLEKEVLAAYDNATLTRPLEGEAWSWRGRAPSGVLIQGVVDKDGDVRTAYPIREPGKPKAPLSNP